MPVNFETFSYPQYNLYNQTFRGQQRNVSGGESTGSMAKCPISGSESTGSMADTENATNVPDNGDKVCFKGHDDNKSKGAAGPIVATLAGATALMILLGCARKYSWFDKISDSKCKNFVVKYMAEPSYKACSWVKGKGNSALNWAKGIFKK